ncbi:MAG: C25 family cysteine peptidase [Chloroflexota bacterium]
MKSPVVSYVILPLTTMLLLVGALVPSSSVPAHAGQIISGQPKIAPKSAEQDPLAFAPTNPAVFQDAVKIHVIEPGIQLITGADLIAQGVPANTSLSSIQIAFRGTEVAVEVWDNGNNTLDTSDSLRFYADHTEHSPTVGDYWNEEEIFWLTFSGSNGLRMGNRNVVPGAESTAPLRSTAMEQGIWEGNRIYESTMSGEDGDNWYHTSLEVSPNQLGNPSTYPTATIPLNNRLPLAEGSPEASQFTVTGAARTVANHTLRADFGGRLKDVSWTNFRFYESWTHVFTSTTSRPQTIQFTLLPSTLESRISFDKLYWEQPVNLDFGNGGATFHGIDGTWRYQLTNVASDAALHDITDVLQPTRLIIPLGTNPQFEDGPEPRRYILTMASDLQQPVLSKHTPVTWSTETQADGLYVAYELFHDELQPLLDLRRTQGYQAEAVDLQSIYDSWSFGHVSPDAVRNMLQYAKHNWDKPPLSAVAVGDSTFDPKNYKERMDGNYNRNIFPTFLEQIDPWQGETACESCFVQLDDAHPLEGTIDKNFLIDMWFGRFSIQDEDQLRDVVNKIVRYETATNTSGSEQSVSLYLADNYHRSDGSLDPTGDFAAGTDYIIENYQTSRLRSQRLYYDPNPAGVTDPWREPNPELANQRAFELLDSGPALATFMGHANHFFLASLEQSGGFLLDFNQLLELTERERTFVMLQMTSWTSQFTHVSRTGTTFDERLQRLPNAGAVAVWGGAGLSVDTGHHFLLQGFHEKLAEDIDNPPHLGELVEAGYINLFQNSICCQDVRYTYVLLGDPLTRLQINPSSEEPTETPTPSPTPTHTPTATPSGPVCRAGVLLNTIGSGPQASISSYDITDLGAGWYSNFSTSLSPGSPDHLDHSKVIRLTALEDSGYRFSPNADSIQTIASENPGSDWFIGVEPDRIKFQDGMPPDLYAAAYHELYHLIKSADSTARLFPGSITQPTPLRLQYLDLILQNYQDAYGVPLPADGWSIHNHILNEASCDHFDDLSICWGADIPPGVDAVEGMRIGISSHTDVAIFKSQIVGFRQWMKENGYTNLPLYVSEMGVLLPDWYQPIADFSPAAVNRFMNETFDFMVTATDQELGDPNDEHRLVQRFAWYSINDDYRAWEQDQSTYPNYQYNGALFNPITFERTEIGDNFAAYIANQGLLGNECQVDGDPPRTPMPPTATPTPTPLTPGAPATTPTPTHTSTFTPTTTPTATPTNSLVTTPTITPSISPTGLPASQTATPTADLTTPVDEPTVGPTSTPTNTPTSTPIAPTAAPTDSSANGQVGTLFPPTPTSRTIEETIYLPFVSQEQ